MRSAPAFLRSSPSLLPGRPGGKTKWKNRFTTAAASAWSFNFLTCDFKWAKMSLPPNGRGSAPDSGGRAEYSSRAQKSAFLQKNTLHFQNDIHWGRFSLPPVCPSFGVVWAVWGHFALHLGSNWGVRPNLPQTYPKPTPNAKTTPNLPQIDPDISIPIPV